MRPSSGVTECRCSCASAFPLSWSSSNSSSSASPHRGSSCVASMTKPVKLSNSCIPTALMRKERSWTPSTNTPCECRRPVCWCPLRPSSFSKKINESKELGKQSSYLDCWKGTDLRRTFCAFFPAMTVSLAGNPIIGPQKTYLSVLPLTSCQIVCRYLQLHSQRTEQLSGLDLHHACRGFGRNCRLFLFHRDQDPRSQTDDPHRPVRLAYLDE
jgi:hypothetical protein